ncbi:unnamed protein product [Rotaria sp. Silwood1]|nr:unnamed protein product [Rotaria sp. Silwood1]CAF1681602.1 unnamed protein product [Rotaria sp. Silwood1]
MSISVNAERCRAYRQRISNVSDRLQNTDTTLSQQGNDISVHQKENIMLMNEDEMVQNDINNYFYQMHDLNDDEIELNSFIYNNNSDDYNDNETNSDSELDYSTDTNDYDNTLLYPNGSISLCQAYAAIKSFIVNPNEGKCSSKCVFNGHQRTADSLTELCQANIFQRIKCVVERNLHLIIEYQQRAHRLVPNDIVNDAVYKQIHTNSKFNRLTLSIHAEGMQVITTKPKKFYVVTGTILQMPPPHREFDRNKLMLVVYLSENEPTPLLLYDQLSQQLQQLINEKYVIIDGEKFNITFQLFKTDLPCRIGSNLGINEIFCQLGGAKNVDFKQDHSIRFDISSVLDQLHVKNDQTLVIGLAVVIERIFILMVNLYLI